MYLRSLGAVVSRFRSPWVVPPRRLLAVGVLLVGVGLTLTGASVHLAATGPTCDGCAPYHPLFVVTPLGLGVLLTTAGGWLLGRT